VSALHCSCGYATDTANDFGDHLGFVFDPDDDIGTDGTAHAEIAHGGPPRHLCACGYGTQDTQDFNDHLLLAVLPPDAIGLDGARHVPVSTATPHHWYAHYPATGEG
jgi:hypothetical protein